MSLCISNSGSQWVKVRVARGGPPTVQVCSTVCPCSEPFFSFPVVQNSRLYLNTFGCKMKHLRTLLDKSGSSLCLRASE